MNVCGQKRVRGASFFFFGNSVLMLKKMNGDWVLPKGKIEANETNEETALREVFEETHVKAKILNYIGDIQYTYRNYWSNNELVDKKYIGI